MASSFEAAMGRLEDIAPEKGRWLPLSQIPLRAVTHIVLLLRECDLVETLIGIRNNILSSLHSLEGDDIIPLL